MEVWKYVSENTDYIVSSYGRVKSLKFKDGKILSQSRVGSGYLAVTLCNKGCYKNRLVHRLIAKAFLENKENKKQVNHINGMKSDNRLVNIEWATRSENQLHSINSKLRTTRGSKNSQAKLNEKQVLEILNDDRLYSDIVLEYNISISTVSDIKRGYSWTHITGLKDLKNLKSPV